MFNNLPDDTNITPMVYSYHKNPKSILEMLPKYETSTVAVQYDTNFTYDNYVELKALVIKEMHEKKIPFYWSTQEIAYNIAMLSLYFGTTGYVLCNPTLPYYWLVLLSVMNTGTCNLIFHEASHYSAFKNQTLNYYTSLCLYPFATENFWKYRHNFQHHCFTNTEHDIDFACKGEEQTIRHAPYQKYTWYNSFQTIYIFLLFQFTLLYYGPFKSLVNNRQNWISLVSFLYAIGLYKTFFLFSLNGLLFTLIAQVSHIQPECVVLDNRKNEFLHNQAISSLNYRTDDIFTRFLCFGLDIQIEHHMFPNFPHSSLRKIQHVIKDYCKKKDIPYREKASFFEGIFYYMKHIHTMSLR